MDKILSIEQAIKISGKLRKQDKTIVLAGGCFDILHIGHITFLEKAKGKGDILYVFLEHDRKIKELKGPHRPINSQEDRAKILASLAIVDYVVKLPYLDKDSQYDDLLIAIKPAIIATTAGDPNRYHKERTAKLICAAVDDVIAPIENQSTTRLIHMLKE